MNTLEAFGSGDGAHWGLSDWYPEQEAALKQALEARQPFDTGWYSSKKEIASARISSPDGKTIRVEASVSDDFDTPGQHEEDITSWTLEAVAEALSVAWSGAEENRKDNQDYVGYSILHHADGRSSWVETFLGCVSTWGDSVPPGGDHYQWWGWQHDEEGEGANCTYPGIPASTAEAFENFARDLKTGSLRIGDWEIQSWDKEAA
jgi:hypothetical protein